MNKIIFTRMLRSFLFLFFFVTQNAAAYVASRNGSGQVLRWGSSAAPSFYTNWTNGSGLTYSQIFSAFTHSLGRWRDAGSANVNFNYWQSSNTSTAPANSNYNGRNSVFFTSQSSTKLGSSTLAVTYVYSSSGKILEADIAFNDDDFTFTTVESDSTRFGDGEHVFLENVATHEFGHAYGMAHSAALQSSMVYLEYRGQARLSCDDIEGISVLYPVNDFTSGRGSISGNVGSVGTNVFGAQVQAISKNRGTVIAAAITDTSGNFTIENLEPDSYYLFYEPFQGTSYISSLCGGTAAGCYFSSANAATICNGQPFKRGFLTTGVTGVLSAVSVVSSQTTSTGSYDVKCSDLAGATAYSSIGASNAGPMLASTSSGAAAKVYTIGTTGAVQYVKLDNVSGDISADAVAFGLYSPIDISLKLVDSSGSEVSGSVATDNIYYDANTGYKNYDSRVTYANAPQNDYYIKITNLAALAKSKYPAGFATTKQVDTVRYYALIVTIGNSPPYLPSSASPTLALNSRCEAVDSVSAYSDRGEPSELPLMSSAEEGTSSSGSSSSSGGGCGVIKNTQDSKGSFKGPGANALFSVWGLMFLMLALRILHQNFARKLASYRDRS